MEDEWMVKLTFIIAFLSISSMLIMKQCRMEEKKLEVIDKEIMNETKLRGGDV